MTPKARTWFDHDLHAWCHTAPDGYRFGGDLHEFIFYTEPGCGETKRDAVRDFKEREEGAPLELCTDAECDWCHPVPEGAAPEGRKENPK